MPRESLYDGNMEDRWKVLRALWSRGWVRWCVYIWAPIGAYDTFASQLLPPSWRDRAPTIYQVVTVTSGWLSWQEWLLIGMAILLAATFEYAVRQSRSLSGTGKWILLKDVAQLAYDENRASWIAREARGNRDQDPVHGMAGWVLGCAPRVYGKLRGATVYDEIPEGDRNIARVSADITAFDQAGSGSYFDVAIQRGDLADTLSAVKSALGIFE